MRGNRAQAFAARAVVAALTWWALTDGAMQWDAWLIGMPAILVTAAISTALLPPFAWSWRGALRFAVFFLWESWRGGVDVARRAFHPRMPLAPGLFDHELSVSPDLARVAVVNTSSLLPGSLVVDLAGRKLSIHALDLEQRGAARTVAAAEARIAAMFAFTAATEDARPFEPPSR